MGMFLSLPLLACWRLAADPLAAHGMTALGKIIREIIREDGPMPLDRYMTLCLGHPATWLLHDPRSPGGIRVTSPPRRKSRQVFGELIGVWVAQVWQSLGSPRHFALVELGPGRGTLMADMLRVLAKVEGCGKAAEVHFVETSPVLRAAQQERVPHGDMASHRGVACRRLPAIIIANEFFDALPIRQFERRGTKVFERCVGCRTMGWRLALCHLPAACRLRGEGVFEDQSIRNAVAREMADQVATTRRCGAGDRLWPCPDGFG